MALETIDAARSALRRARLAKREEARARERVRREMEQARAICERLGINFEILKAEGLAHGRDDHPLPIDRAG
jgi:hypothetical protein